MSGAVVIISRSRRHQQHTPRTQQRVFRVPKISDVSEQETCLLVSPVGNNASNLQQLALVTTTTATLGRNSSTFALVARELCKFCWDMGTTSCCTWAALGANLLLLLLSAVLAIEHNLPDNVELVDPKDLGLENQFDLDKLLGNVKALPIDGNAISSALGKPGLKTQVLTVGFDGSEGINLDDFELPHLKNDEHGPLAQEAFKSFKNFFRNTSSATQFEGDAGAGAKPEQKQEVEPIRVTTHRPSGGKRRTMMKRRKVLRANGTTTTTTTPAPSPAQGPKVIELDSSQIEKLIASGKIGPPKSLTPGGPQIIELGQRDLDALLSGDNAEEIKQILEGGDSVKDFDLSQITSGSGSTAFSPTSQQQTESSVPLSASPVVETSPPPQVQVVTQELAPVESTPPPQTETVVVPTTAEQVAQAAPTSTPPPNLVLQQENGGGLPIIYQYNSAQEQHQFVSPPHQPIQSPVPLQFYSSHANGQQQAKLVRHPTFELISAPPVSFSSSVLPNTAQNSNNEVPAQYSQVVFQQQQQPHLQQQQQQQQFRNTFISPQASSNFIPASAPPAQQSVSNPTKEDSSLNKILPAKQQSAHTEQIKPHSSVSLAPQGNFIQTLHKVNLPLNSVKLVTPSPQVVHSLLNQVPEGFQPSLAPNHVVSSPVVDPLRVNGQHQHQSNGFIGGGAQEPFRNTQLFNSAPTHAPVRASSSVFRFPSTSSSIFSNGGPNRFRTAESTNPFFAAGASRFTGAGAGPNLVLNSFVAGDGLNYRPRSNQDFRAPGI